jgi:serum/glucocorticoid-regulated kinase 2
MAHMLINSSISSSTDRPRLTRRKSSVSGPSGGGGGLTPSNSAGNLSSSLPRSMASFSSRRSSMSRKNSASGTNLASSFAPSSLSSSSVKSSSPPTSSSSSLRRASSRSKQRTAVATPNVIDLKTISAEEVEWEGYLYKQRKIVKSWTPRYITLQNRTIAVYKSKTHALGKEQHRGSWVIKQILSSLPSAGFGGSKLQPDLLGFSFLATNGNLIHLIAVSQVEKAMWMHMMQLSLHRANAAEATTQIHQARPRDVMVRTRSVDDIVTLETSITTHLATKFLEDLIHLLGATSTDAVTDHLPSFLRQLSKDVELLFDLETAETNQPSCVFKGIYHGREGFVHFAALYASKYLLATNVNEEPNHKADDDDHHSFTHYQHRLMNTVSGSTTDGKFGLQITFTPARRISRVVLSFRQRGLSSKTRRVSTNPMSVAAHPICFHQYCLSKRSLAISFSDFDVVGVLGQGGFGTVVLVKRHLSSDEYFAIKIIDKQSGAESALKERRIMSGVRHPFLACLRFAFQTQSKLYLGMDYYKGGNLYLHMHSSKMDPNVSTSSGRRFSIERARFYAAELAIALAYLHAHGIIYRDLKPDNIMLDKSGHIRLVDFGISKQLAHLNPDTPGANAHNHNYAPTGTLAGSPAYIAPEQLLTQKPQYGMEADWWSYGVLLYEMLTGSTPFFDPNISQMYKKIQTADIKYDRYPPIDDTAVDLLKKLLVRDPAQRISYAEVREHEFFRDIQWAKLELKEVEPPFIPPTEELMQNVHEHFRNMNVKETIGDLQKGINGGRKAAGNMGGGTVDESHFDEFSFAFDATRDTFDGLSMADDGWLMQQLQEGAAMRGRLKEQDADPETEELGSEDDLTSTLMTTQGSHSSEEISDEGEAEGEVTTI